MNETLDASSGTKVIEKVGAKNTVDQNNFAVETNCENLTHK